MESEGIPPSAQAPEAEATASGGAGEDRGVYSGVSPPAGRKRVLPGARDPVLVCPPAGIRSLWLLADTHTLPQFSRFILVNASAPAHSLTCEPEAQTRPTGAPLSSLSGS